MAFKGDVGQISLLNIYQALNLNQQGGILVISSGGQKRRIRFVADGVRLLTNGPGDSEPLRQILVKLRILTESQLQNVISTKNDPSQPLGDFLVQRRLVDVDSIAKGISKHALELVYETFFWKPAKYEFSAGDDGDEYEFFDPASYGPYMTYRVEGVLMEVARREDEWERIREVITSDKEIFAPTNPSTFRTPRKYSSELSPDDIAGVKKVIDGERTVERVTKDTTVSRYEAHRAVVLLFSEGEIRPLSQVEKKALAERLRKKFKLREVIDIYEQIVVEAPDDVDTRIALVGILEKKRDNEKELISHYHHLADHFDALGEVNSAKGYLERALEFDPNDLRAHERLFDIHWKLQKEREALAAARLAVDAVKVNKAYGGGAELLDRVIERFPNETTLYHDSADFHQFDGDPEAAISRLKEVAEIYEEREDLTRVRKVYERIASIDPSESATLRKYQDLERKTTKTLLRRVTPTLVAAAAALAVFGAIYWVAMDLLCRSAYAASAPEIETLVSSGHYDEAALVLTDLQRIYPLSSMRWTIATRVRDIVESRLESDREQRLAEEKKNTFFTSYLAQVTKSLRDKKYTDAWKKLRTFDRNGLNKANLEKLRQIEAEIETVFRESKNVLAKAKALVRAGKYPEAHAEYVRLLMNYPYTPAARGLEVPLVLATVPPGATVEFNGKPVGKSPLLLHYNPFRRFSLRLTKPGFREYSCGEGTDVAACVEFNRDWSLTVPLERVPDWIGKVPTETTAPLGFGEDAIYVPGRDGKIRCHAVEDGRRRWLAGPFGQFGLPDRPRAWNGRVFFGTKVGDLIALEVTRGEVFFRLQPFGDSWPGTITTSAATEDGLVCISGGPNLAAVDLASGKTLWKSFSRDFAESAPSIHERTVLRPTDKGSLIVFSLKSGRRLSTIDLGKSTAPRGVADGDSYFVVDESGVIFRIRLKTGEIVWSYRCERSHLLVPVVTESHLVVNSQDGYLVGLDRDSGSRKWEFSLSEEFASPGVVWRDLVVFGSRVGRIFCVDPDSGKLSWTFTTGSGVTGPPLAGGNRLFVVTESGKLFSFLGD